MDVDTYLSGNILFENGAIAQIFTTFDVYYGRGAQARFEVYGTQGTLVVPDPQHLWRPPCCCCAPRTRQPPPPPTPPWSAKRCPPSTTGTRKSPCCSTTTKTAGPWAWRTCARPLRTGRDHRANYQQQRHVLEIMTSFSKSCQQGEYIALESGYTRTAPMKNNPMHGVLDD